MEVVGPYKSKSGKQFSILKVSDLVKYDIQKVKKVLEAQALQNRQLHGETEEQSVEWLRMSEKQFNSNGYKTLKIMAFQEVATPISKLTIGTVVGVLNPRVMKQQAGVDSKDNAITFSIELEAQVFKIGFSEELTFCKGVPQTGSLNLGLPVLTSSLSTQCRNFMNKSVESLCDTHKFMMQEKKLQEIRSRRLGLHSDFIDLNMVRKQQALEEVEKNIGAFGRKGFKSGIPFQYQQSKPQELSPKSAARLEAQNKREQDMYTSYIKDRG